MKNLTCKLGVLVLLAAAAGCDSPTLIDRTQPNYVKKSELLNGSWYIQETDRRRAAERRRWRFRASAAGWRRFAGRSTRTCWSATAPTRYVPGIDPRVDPANSRIGHVVFKDGQPYKGSPVVGLQDSEPLRPAAPVQRGDRRADQRAGGGHRRSPLVRARVHARRLARQHVKNYSFNVRPAGRRPDEPGQLGGSSATSPTRTRTSEREQLDRGPRRPGRASTTSTSPSEVIIDPPSIYYPGYGNIPYCLLRPAGRLRERAGAGAHLGEEGRRRARDGLRAAHLRRQADARSSASSVTRCARTTRTTATPSRAAFCSRCATTSGPRRTTTTARPFPSPSAGSSRSSTT